MIEGVKQSMCWTGDFGRKYTDRNSFSLVELNRLYIQMYGMNLKNLNTLFVGKMRRNMRILEVGTNVGNQLLMLQKMGFTNLYGIDINPYAVEIAKKRKGIQVIQGFATDIPFKDGYFDLVFTAGVLIHIDPFLLPKVINEIVRCSCRYIWGYEYYMPKLQELPYRGNGQLMWKGDYAGMYQKQNPKLKLIKQKFLKYIDNDNVDAMFLLRKT